MNCLGYPPFYQPEMHPHFVNGDELDLYTSAAVAAKVEQEITELVHWVHDPDSRPRGFSVKDPFILQEVSILKLAMSNPYIEWEPYIGPLEECLPQVAREGGFKGIGKMSPWAKLFEALAIRAPCIPEIQEAAETLWDYGNVDCRFKAVIMLGFTRLRDASSFLLEIFEKDPVLNIRTNAINSITKIGWSNEHIISTLRGYYERGLFKHAIAANLYRFTGEWEYLDFIASELEDPHDEKTVRLLEYLEPWPRYICNKRGCGNPVYLKEYWWQTQIFSLKPSFYQAYTDWMHGTEDSMVCWSCSQAGHKST